jgi:hypothetical protein
MLSMPEVVCVMLECAETRAWAGRVLPGGDALAAQGGDIGGAGDGERSYRARTVITRATDARGREGGAVEYGSCVLQAVHYWILNCEKSRGTRGGDGGGVGGVGGVERVLRGRLVVRRGPRVRAGTVSSVWTSHSVAHAIAPV